MSLFSSISILMLILLSNIHVAHALSATTANTIQGTEPYLTYLDGTNTVKLQTLDELLGFTMPDKSGGETQIDISKATSIDGGQ